MNPDATRKILIDTDTASDDAVALIMALRSPEVKVLAITVVAGDVSVEQGTRNALFTAELCDPQFPYSPELPRRWCARWRMPRGSTAAMASAITAINRPRSWPKTNSQ